MEFYVQRAQDIEQEIVLPRTYSKTRFGIAPLLPANVESVLEIGCGTGGTMSWLRSIRSVAYAAAVEISSADGAMAMNSFDDVEIGDIASVPMNFRTAHFDLILALDVLEHLTNAEKTLAILYDRLKPGGTIIISLPNVAHYHVACPLMFKGEWEYADEGPLDRTHLRFFTESTARRMIEQCGLTLRQVQYTCIYPNVFAMFGLRSRQWRWYSHRLLQHILIWPARLFRYQFVFAATRP